MGRTRAANTPNSFPSRALATFLVLWAVSQYLFFRNCELGFGGRGLRGGLGPDDTPDYLRSAPFDASELSQANHLVVVCGHAIFVSEDLSKVGFLLGLVDA